MRGIDPDSIPSPVTVKDLHKEQFERGYFTSDGPPPSATVPCRIVDNGSCHPAFIRSSLYLVPTTSQLLTAAKVPLMLCVTPFAEVPPESMPAAVPLVDHGKDGPVRCSRCKAFVNPHISFVDAGRRFRCNFCGLVNDVPEWYFCNLNASGVRNDFDSRLELQYGSVDFAVPAAYCPRPPQPPTFVFVVDVSYEAVQNGMIGAVCQVGGGGGSRPRARRRGARGRRCGAVVGGCRVLGRPF